MKLLRRKASEGHDRHCLNSRAALGTGGLDHEDVAVGQITSLIAVQRHVRVLLVKRPDNARTYGAN